MIVFHGAALESVAPVMIEDIRVGPIVQTPVTRDRPLAAGANFIRDHQGTRSIMISFGLLTDDPFARQRQIDAITAWATTQAPAPMQLPYHMGKAINVKCTGLPEPSARQWWESRLVITFTAYDPYFYSIAEKSAACGTAFFVAGNAPPIMRIVRTLDQAASDQAYSDGENTMTFSTIPAGEMEIDLERQTAAVGNASIMQYYAFGSTFILPKTGEMTITGSGTVKWIERWET